MTKYLLFRGSAMFHSKAWAIILLAVGFQDFRMSSHVVLYYTRSIQQYT